MTRKERITSWLVAALFAGKQTAAWLTSLAPRHVLYPSNHASSLFQSPILNHAQSTNKFARFPQHSFDLKKQTTTILFSTRNHNDYLDDIDLERETDPFRILGLSTATADAKEIKRAYKRMALKFHPDVATNKDSTPEERKKAGDRFAKINWAYERLSGKGSGGRTSTSSSSSSSTSTSSTSTGWEPPHRRKGPYSSSSTSSTSSCSSSSGSSFNDDWFDYFSDTNRGSRNRYNDPYDAQYDAGGDSFGKIFADLMAGAAAAASSSSSSVSGGGIFRDLVEFLEQTADIHVGESSDADLRILLQTGTVQDIGDEMDDTQLLVDQLDTKLRALEQEIWTTQAELAQAVRYREKIELETTVQELQARQRVVKDYERKARKRLIALQTRYKELIVAGGRGDDYGRTSARRDPYGSSSAYSSYSSSSSANNRDPVTPRQDSRQPSSYSSSSSSSSSKKSSDDDDSWKTDSFGSFGRRGSSRAGRSRTRSRPTSDDVNARGSSSSPRYSESSSSYRSTSSSGTASGNPTDRASSSSSSSSGYSGASASSYRSSTPSSTSSSSSPSSASS